MKTTKFLTLAAMATAFISCEAPSIEKQVDELYQRMTPEERLAQLHGVYIADFFDENNQLDTAKCRAELPYGAGHFSQYAVTQRHTPDELRNQVKQMQTWIKENTPNGVPALFHEEVLTGVAAYEATVYPQQIGMAGSFNPELAARKTQQTAADFRKIGGRLALSPMVDVVRKPSFNRLEESYGEDAYLSAAMGVAFVKGLQHADISDGVLAPGQHEGNLHTGIAACTKHFLGYGGGGDAPLKERMEEILLPHEAIIRTAGSQVVMTGYHAVDDVKAVANSQLQQELLRTYLHFDGMLVSDYGSIEQNMAEPDEVHQAAAAINAGNDVDFPTGNRYKMLPQAMEQGLVSEATFKAAVKRVLTLKAKLGMLDEDAVLYEEGHIEWDSEANRQTSYELATQSVVLLENNGVLPLKTQNQPLKLALVGPNANSMWAMLGDYTYHSMRFFWQRQIEDDMHPRIVGLKQGLEDRLPEGMELLYSRGCDWTEEVETVIEDGGDERAAYMRSIQERKIDSGEEANEADALRIAKESDVIIAAVGENVILCGENRDRKHLRLPGNQEAFVRKLIATGKPVVLVVFGGRAQVLGDLPKQCAAVLQAWYPGEEGGHAVADLLLGNVAPSAKLSVTYPAVEWSEALCYNYGLQEGDPRVAYPFGYGLTYTTFDYTNMRADKEVALAQDAKVNVSIDVTNIGNAAATEIVELYLSPVDRSAKIRPIQLQGFKRVALEPGDTETVKFALSTEQFGYYMDGHWCVDPGRYMVRIGASSQDIRFEQEVALTGNQYETPLRHQYFAQ